jgi:hypothetical protein
MKLNSKYDRRGGFWAKRLTNTDRNRTPFWDMYVPWNKNEWDRRGDFWGIRLPDTEKMSHSVMFA